MRYGDFNFTHSFYTSVGALLFWAVLIVSSGVFVASLCRDYYQQASVCPSQHTLRNLPEGNMLLLR